MTSELQIEANRRNAARSCGPKTEVGKAHSRKNAEIHGILANVFNEEDVKFVEDARKHLEENPVTAFKSLLLERCAVWILRLERAKVYEREFLKAKLDPPKVEVVDAHVKLFETRVINEGHIEILHTDHIERMTETLLRYETSCENRLLKCVKLLKEFGLF